MPNETNDVGWPERPDAPDGPALGGRLETVARGLMGAGSGGVLGLLVAGLLGAGNQSGQGISVAWMAALMLCFAAGVALLNLLQKKAAIPAAPRVLWGAVLTSVALLITLAVFLFQSLHIEAIIAKGGRVELPLSIWPVSRLALWVSLIAVVLGVVAAFLGWAEVSREEGRYSGRKWVATAMLAAAAWAGLALACYTVGYGFVFAG